MKKIISVVALAVAPFAAHGAVDEAPYRLIGQGPTSQAIAAPPQELIQAARQVAHRYATAIACNVQEESAMPAFIAKPFMDGQLEGKIVVVWYGDIGCQGGNGTTTSNVAIVTSNGYQLTIDMKQSSPNVAFPVPGMGIDRVVGHTSKSITATGYDWDSDDAHCCASLVRQYTMVMTSNGNWKLTKNKVIRKEKKN